ncbi:MAG TPA: TadE/TadG family type IV pilus assembly protein [Candidatus Saccharimonadales bacterium]|nr:TadE/TadG family type IV pilus assembly protein [Candidatus Saccharimonadales bacterium]
MGEFALVAPLFFLLVFGLIEFGRAMYYVQILNNAAREGARYAIVHGSAALCPSGPLPGGGTNPCDPSGANVVVAARRYAFGVVDNGTLTVTRCWNSISAPSASCDNAASNFGPGNDQRGSPVYVQVSLTYSTILGSLVPIPTFTIQGESTLVVNH